MGVGDRLGDENAFAGREKIRLDLLGCDNAIETNRVGVANLGLGFRQGSGLGFGEKDFPSGDTVRGLRVEFDEVGHVGRLVGGGCGWQSVEPRRAGLWQTVRSGRRPGSSGGGFLGAEFG